MSYPQHPNQSMYPQNVPFGAGFQAPPNQSPYPPSQGGYPQPAQGGYPQPAQGGYPQPAQGGYPQPAPGGFPQQSPGGYPQPAQGGYPQPAQGGYPQPSQGGYPQSYPAQSPYPSQGQSPYPPSQSPYPSAGYPPAGNTPYPSYGAGMPVPPNTYHSSPQAQPQRPQQNSPYPPSSTNVSSPYGHTQGQPQQYEQSRAYSTANSAYPAATYAASTPKKGTPTLIPPQSFDPVKDAHDLRKAMKGFGTDEDGLIKVLCFRSNAQRQEIQRQYKTQFGRDLVEDIKSECSGNFETLLVALCYPAIEYYCRELSEAMTGLGTDEDVLIETMCTLSNGEIEMIKQTYRRMYGRDLERELTSETSGYFKRLLRSLCAGGRDESGVVDRAAAQTDANDLFKAGVSQIGTDEITFTRIMCSRNYQQLRMVFQEYQNMTGHTLETAIKNEFSGDIEEGLVSIYRCVMDKAEFFASRLKKSMAGMGTNDRQLIRIIVTRCEIDLQDVKTAFERKYGKSLKNWIKSDTTGDYKHALYALIGEPK